VLRGLKLCTEKPCPLRNEIMTSPDFWVVLQTLATNADAAPAVFEILDSGVSDTPSAIMADNYEAALGLLNEFASMASVGAVAEQKNDRKQGRKGGRPVKQEKPRLVLAVVVQWDWLLTRAVKMLSSSAASRRSTAFPA
jgi:brefeldin A-resistance guanine nucleotide exchange factor 1